MPIPYMGSKRKSSRKIFNTISNFNPDGKILVDLFCGGFAISEEFLKRGWEVVSNDKNKHVIALLKQTVFDGLDEKKVTEFVTRERFNDVLKNPSKYDDWYVGYVQCIWSFGNNQKGYLFGKDTEGIKKAGHELVINKNAKLLNGLIPEQYIKGIIKQDNWKKRRIALAKVARVMGASDKKLQQLQNLQPLQQLERLEQLQQLQRLERLQQLEQLERLQQLEIFNKSYDEIVIPENAIVYCDPPYKETAEYKEGGFNHDKFWAWVNELSKTNKIYISEYTAPEGFKRVLEFSQRSTLQGGSQKHNNQPNECLFAPISQDCPEWNENDLKTN
jgi:site-specific DNA-adenine methylase